MKPLFSVSTNALGELDKVYVIIEGVPIDITDRVLLEGTEVDMLYGTTLKARITGLAITEGGGR